MCTAVLQVIISQLAKYEEDQMKMTGKSQNADSGKEIKDEKKNKKEKITQQQKGLPTLSADLETCLYSIGNIIQLYTVCQNVFEQNMLCLLQKYQADLVGWPLSTSYYQPSVHLQER